LCSVATRNPGTQFGFDYVVENKIRKCKISCYSSGLAMNIKMLTNLVISCLCIIIEHDYFDKNVSAFMLCNSFTNYKISYVLKQAYQIIGITNLACLMYIKKRFFFPPNFGFRTKFVVFIFGG